VKIAIVGAGNLGTGLAKHLVPAGHEVTLCFSLDAQKLRRAALAMGAKSGSVTSAVETAEVVVICPPWTGIDAALAETGPLVGKVIWDCTNPLKPDLSGRSLGTTISAGEEVQRRIPNAKVVKAIPPFAEMLHGQPASSEKPCVFVCGCDAHAKAIVTKLVQQLGADPQDVGPLSNARYVEPLSMLLVQLAHKQGLGTRISSRVFKLD
jgi:predicted dinucleotide-binding enzyme